MSIEVAPKINLDSINALDANKRYFLSSTTGQIKEASWWMRFKCAIGVGSALAKVSNLVDAVKSTLLERAGKDADSALDADIKDIDVSSNIKGSVLKNLAGRFRAANTTAMLRKEAETLARREAGLGFMYVHQFNLKSGLETDIAPIFRHAFKAVVDGDLPTKQDVSGRTVLDKDALSQRLKEVREATTALLVDIANDERLEHPVIDRHYSRHIITTFFKEDGTRNENALSDALPPDEAFAAHLYDLDDKRGGSATFVHNELVAKGRDPVAYAKNIREQCGGDKDLEDIVAMGLRNICGTGANELRGDETVAKKIAALKENLAEAREVEKKFPGFMDQFREAMFDMGGAAMPKGAIKRMAEAVAQTDFSKLAKLNSFSGCGSILQAVDQLRMACDRIANPWQLFPDKQEDIMFGGGEYRACRRIVQSLATLKAGPAAHARIANAMRGTAAREAAFVLETRSNEANSQLYHGAEKDARKLLFENETETLNDLYSLFLPHDVPPDSPDTDGITWQQAMEHNDETFDDIFDDHVAKALSAPKA